MAYYVQTTDDTAPKSTSATGTFSSVGVEVTGTSTDFTVLVSGDWLVSTEAKCARKVLKVVNATRLILDEAFPSNVTANAFKYVPWTSNKVTDLGIGAGAAGTSVDGEALATGDSVNLTVSEKDKFIGKNLLRPLFVEGSTVGEAKILIKKFKQ